MRLRGRTVIVMGASGGIGRATAMRCAEEGANLAIHYSGLSPDSERRAQALLREVEAVMRGLGTRAIAIRGDVAKRRDVAAMAREVRDAFPRVHGLALLTGHYRPGLWKKRFGEYTEEEEETIWRTDVLGSKYCVAEFAPLIAASIREERLSPGNGHVTGSIVLTSSTPALGSIPVDREGRAIGEAFTAAKTAILSIMRHGVLEYSPHVRINTIAPGNVDTDWASELTEEEREAAARESPLKRWIKPVEVANTVVFLLSEESSAVNNQIIALDGGYVTGR